MAFTHLHLHTMFSLRDSTVKFKDLIEKAKKLGHKSIAITDHGYVYGNIDFYKYCHKHSDIKMIYGCELYICDDITNKSKDSKTYHLIALAKNDIGRININKLSSIGHVDGFYAKPRIDYKTLLKHKEGLIITSACLAGEISRSITDDSIETAAEIARKYKRDFGNDYFLEIQSRSDPIQIGVNKEIIKIANMLNIQYIATCDVHYVDKEDFDFHSEFISINQKRDAGETYLGCYYQTEDEVRENLKYLEPHEIESAINNTQIIADNCNVVVPLSAPIIPHATIPTEYGSEYDYLVDLCNQGWMRRGCNKLNEVDKKAYKERLNYELESVRRMGFEGYYLLVIDYIKEAKRKSPGRGSSGGSIIAWLIGITQIDPVKYKLYFERFIDVGALDLLEQGKIQPYELKIPDVDTDMGEEDRVNVLKYLTNKYGDDRVVSIGTFQYYQARSSIKDMGRILGIPFEETNEITEGIDLQETIDEALDRGAFKKYISKYPTLFQKAQKLSGLPKSFSTHASGKIIAQDEIYKYHGVQTNDDGILVIQCDMKSAESLGLVKIDLLGLRTLDVIYNVLDMIGADENYISLDNLNFNDSSVWEVFQNGLTTGIFQFESGGMKQALKLVGVNSLEELAICNALYRPGAKDYISNFAKRKHGEETFEYLHNDLEPILKNSNGIIVFQEQLIDIGRLAKIKNPDDIRVATAKKKIDVLEKVKPELNQNLLNRGWSQETFDKLWEQVEKFAAYSFNRAHAFLYSVVAYQTAFLKVKHPKEYTCATLNSFKGDIEKLKDELNLIQENNIQIEPINFRSMFPICTIYNDKFYYGSGLIKSCNENIARELMKVRDMQYPMFVDCMTDIIDNCSINSKQLEILIKLGAFSEFGGNKKLLKIYNCIQTGENKYDKKYVENTKEKRRVALREIERNEPDEKFNINEQLEIENEYIGTLVVRYNIEKRYCYVRDVNLKYSPRIDLYCFYSGKSESIKVNKRIYNTKPIKIGDIIYCKAMQKKPTLVYLNGKYSECPSKFDWWLNDYTYIDNFEEVINKINK